MSDNSYVGVRIEGGLLPSSLLGRLADVKSGGLDGSASADYGLAHGETVREAANRVWAYLRTVWAGYRSALADLSESDRATTLTRERWLLILLDQFGYGRVPPGKGLDVDGKHFPVSHAWGQVPIHLLGSRIDLDRRTSGVAGAAGQAPQSMVQELLNRSDDHLWAVLSNGSTLRLLRDSTSLVGSAYIDFDLEAIFDGELFSDFLVMFTLAHASRLAVRDEEIGADSCWLEQWRETAVAAGSRALDQLRVGVVEAIETLGSGFLAHPSNAELRAQVEADEISLADYNHALLRVIYRLLFSFVAEDRGVLLDPAAPPEVRQRYIDYFSTDRLRRVARKRRGGRHGDRWQALNLVWSGLGRSGGRPELALAGIGGLFERGPLDFLADAQLSNEALLGAVRALSQVSEKGSGHTRLVDYKHLDSEELGSIYESLLEYVPQWDAANRRYHLGSAAGNSRKTTGSYYTPTSLIETLLDTALDPVIATAAKGAATPDDAVAALLGLTVCDPACGSGHFLVGAARRIAKALAAARAGDPEPPPEQVRSALREVIGTCIYGVDINPLAAELAKVSLWLEAMEPGRPLAFLDAHIKVGNSLVGATPALLDAGLPQDAFKAIEGDDKKVVSALAKRNKEEAPGQGSLFGVDEARTSNAELVPAAAALTGMGASMADVHVQQQRLRQYVDSDAYRSAKLHADAWCAAFVWPKTNDAVTCPTNGALEDIRRGAITDGMRAETERLASEYRFFHWHLEFPHIFPTERPESGGTINPATGWYGGFSAVLGNPPWERVKLQEQEFFASRDPDIANAPNAAARKRLIKQLPDTNPALHGSFLAAKRRAEGESHVLRNSGRFPLAGRGDINTYAVFSEGNRAIVGERGRLGIIVPTGIATDATTQYFFRDLVETGALASLYDFENAKPLFDGVHRSFKFCLLTLSGRDSRVPAADFAFFAHDPVDLKKDDVRFTLTPEEITLLNPNTGTCPVFRSRRDAEITLGIYRRVPVLINENDPENGNPWGIKFMTMFHMSNDSHLFHTRDELEADGWVLNRNVFERPISNGGGVTFERMLPLYEAKMIHHYDTKWATYMPDGSTRDVTPEEKRDPDFHVMPRYWVHKKELKRLLPDEFKGTGFFAFRNIARATDARTIIGTLIPVVPVGHSMPLMFSHGGRVLQAAMTSIAMDYVLRQKLGGTNLTYNYIQQLPMPKRQVVGAWPMLDDRVDRLNSQWLDIDTNARLRAELDALMFHLFGVSRADADYIMETFPIVKRNDMKAYGEYRTKRLVLDAYDRLAPKSQAVEEGLSHAPTQ
ncbi:Eco57I restriction-modification methylase domain-containing protein [Kribbia dieselivorans]|uniref:Eco57I restriction-modification methylase domain-containing protein n=1 Tax=Kribbia dieselivorans TaxID=331526 RepID=UPI0008397CEE|nr:N-6 DNA methylase [Kribbia dieselivorans]